MAEEFKDPRDVDWHPRRRSVLLGHAAAEARLLQAHQSGKLHHSWLISGNRGIGKATLAYRFARFLFHVPDPQKARAHASLHVPEDAPAAHLVAAATHPDLLVIERNLDTRSKRIKSEIAVDTARKTQGFFSQTSGLGGWRIAIVDSADDLNGESANALLKMIEEPPQRSLFLLVCHQPGGLLRTIRSRCIHLMLDPLDEQTTINVLQGLPDEAVAAADGEVRQAAAMAHGSPGRALDLIGSKGAAAFAAFLQKSRLTPGTCVEIGAMFAGREAADDYDIFCELLTGWIAAQAREAALQGRGVALAEAHDDIRSSLRQTDALNLDRRQTVTDALTRLEEALKAS